MKILRGGLQKFLDTRRGHEGRLGKRPKRRETGRNGLIRKVCIYRREWQNENKIREQFVTPFNRQFLSFLAEEEELQVIRLIFNGSVWKTTASSSLFQRIFILVVAFNLITLLPDRLLWSRRLLFLLFYFNFALSSFRGYVWACWPPMFWEVKKLLSRVDFTSSKQRSRKIVVLGLNNPFPV